jgi:hypothetical protein
MESLKVNIHSPHERKWKALKRQELQDDVRRRYSVIMPSPSTWYKLVDDFPRVTGRKINICYHEDELISFWRQNKGPTTLSRRRKGGSLPSSTGGTWRPVTLCVVSFVSTSFQNYLDLCIFLDLLAMRHCFIFVVPDEELNDGHLPAPKEKDEGDDEDDDHEDDDDNDHYDPDY